MLIRKFRTRKRALITIASKAVVLGTTVALALAGQGAWSIVLGSLAGAAAASLMYWSTAPRSPRLRLSRPEARTMLRFGAAVASNALLRTISTRLFLSLFGYFHGALASGYLNLGLRLIDESGAVISRIAWKIGNPMLAKTHRDQGGVEEQLHAITRYASYFAAPVFLGFSATMDFLIPLLLGREWTATVPLAQALAGGWAVTLAVTQLPAYLRTNGQQNLLLTFKVLDAALATGIVFATSQWPFQEAALA